MPAAFIPSAVVRDALEQYEAELKRRREVSTADPVADGIAYVVRDIKERVARAERDAEPLTAEQFAALRHVSPAAVRKWCAQNRIAGAYRAPDQSWRIPRDADVSVRSVAA